MLWFYRILFLPLLLAVGPFYLRRMWRRGGYRKGFVERFGKIGPTPPSHSRHRIWLQAVSVGEVLAAKSLIESLNKKAEIDWILTCTTSTGYAVAQKELASMVYTVGYFPLDFWWFSRAAWKRIQPDLAILMESELWPEHLHQAKRHQTPVVLVNARLSDRSFRRYRRFRWLTRAMATRHLDLVLAGSEEDAERFRELDTGLKVISGGNLKLVSAPLSGLEPSALEAVLGSLFDPDLKETPVLIGASTWPGEELFLLELQDQAQRDGSPFRLMLVPRHAERALEIATLLEERNRPFTWRSRNLPASGPAPRTAIHLADTTGELKQLLTLADVAFIGKSLPPHTQGQTPVEAALQGVPLVYGPGMDNFREICASLERAGATMKCRNREDAAAMLVDLLFNTRKREEQKKAASDWRESNRGGLTKTTDQILNILQCSRRRGSCDAQSPPRQCEPEEQRGRSC